MVITFMLSFSADVASSSLKQTELTSEGTNNIPRVRADGRYSLTTLTIASKLLIVEIPDTFGRCLSKL
jgi:hypothetical protein